jgi:mono/diheme cytochrome c family protein
MITNKHPQRTSQYQDVSQRPGREHGLRTVRIAALAVFGLIAALGVTLFATERQEGPSALFKEFCARCHGEDGTGNTPKGKQLMARDFTDADWRSAKSDADLIKAIVAGGEAMPAFGKKLTPEQIESLVKNDIRGFARKK